MANAATPQTVSIVIPAKDEEANIGLVLDDVNASIAEIPDRQFEVIVVDDKSTDRTAAIALEKGVEVVSNPGKSGKGRALRVGFAHSTGEIIIMMDADYSHRAEEFPLFLDAFADGVGLVIGSRVMGGSDEYTPIRAAGNIFFTYMMGVLMRRYLSDALNGFKAFRREVFDDFTYTAKQFEIEIELIGNTLRRGYRVVEVTSHERARRGGEEKSRVVRHGTGFLMQIIKEWARGVRPRDAA